MPVLEAETTIHRPPEDVFDALCDLRRYEAYSDHLAEVVREGDGGVGTEYELQFEWWLVGYTVRSEVTGLERPERLDFEVTEGIAAEGSWYVESKANPTATDEAEPKDGDGNANGRQDNDGGPVTRVRFVVDYHPETVAESAVRLPSLASLSWVVEKVAPLVEREAAGVVERVVQDLEGSDRAVELDVTIH